MPEYHRTVRGFVGRRTRHYAWHETPNIDLCTLRDFEDLLRDERLRIARRIPLGERHEPASGAAAGRLANLLAAGAVYVLERD